MAKNSNTSLGCLFWIALVLLVIVIFLFNQENIQAILQRTGFLTLFEQENTEAEEPSVTITYTDDAQEQEQNDKPVDDGEEPQEVILKVDEIENDPQNEENDTEIADETDQKEEIEENPNLRKARLFFISEDSEEKIIVKAVIRNIHYNDAPLTQTIKSLFAGPNAAEHQQGLLTLIPKSTRLNQIWVKNNTAYIDLNDDFRFNPLGSEGLNAQLKQIVYTATEFVNVKQVQILIDTKKIDFLTADGIYVGKPLSRASFN